MPEHWIDLVDQYVCPNCTSTSTFLPFATGMADSVALDMADSKRTTWKQRCKYGLEQPDPSLPSVCHKPVRAEGSKYCSDECGVRHMKARIDAWTAQGGRCDQLWESVKLAPKPEGVVVLAPDAPVASVTPMPVEPATKGKPLSVEYQPEPLLPAAAPPESRLAREAARLRAQIDGWAAQRAALRTELAHVAWRERLLALAARRADGIDECGWDQRLCFGDAEIIEFGEGVHESYAEASVQDGEELQLEEVGQWWCRGKRKCDRHAGCVGFRRFSACFRTNGCSFRWQKLRASDIAKEKDLKEEALAKFAAREQANRKRIENLLAPQSKPSPDLGAQISTSARTDAKPRTNGQASKRGKKRKAD